MKLKIALLVLLCFSFGIAQQKNTDKGKWEELKEYPKPISPIQPEYPQIAKLAGIEGKVYVEALISETGEPLETKLLKSDNDVLNQSAFAAIMNTTFSPGINKEGKRIKAWVVIPISFKLDKDLSKQKLSKTEKQINKDEELNPVDKMPEILEQEMPVYPPEAKKAGVTGKVFVKVFVDEEGSAKEAKVIKSDNEILNQAAVDAVLKTKFYPAMYLGKPIAVWIVLPYRFTLSGVKDSNEREYFTVLGVGMDNALYPKEALEKKIEGKVLVRISLDDDGKLKNAEIYKSDNELLDKAAITHLMNNWDKTYLAHNKALKEAKEKGKIVPAEAELRTGSIICVDFMLKDFEK